MRKKQIRDYDIGSEDTDGIKLERKSMIRHCPEDDCLDICIYETYKLSIILFV